MTESSTRLQESSTRLQEFEDYILDEYRDACPTFAAAAFKYFHHVKVKTPTKRQQADGNTRPIRIDSVRVSLKLVDSAMNGLLVKSISFENNSLTRACSNSLINISPDELENRFACALPTILSVIQHEYDDVTIEMQDKSTQLVKYAKANDINIRDIGRDHSVAISREYKRYEGTEDPDPDSDDNADNRKTVAPQTGVSSVKSIKPKKVKQVFDM